MFRAARCHQNGEMDLSAALTAYDRVALNLEKLDRVWQRMEELLPDGPFIGIGLDDDVTYAQLGEQWTTIVNSLPAIDGWKLEAEIVGYAEVGQCRVDCLEIDEPGSLWAFEAHVAAPRIEAFRYRQKLARARQQLVRGRSEGLIHTVDELLSSGPHGHRSGAARRTGNLDPSRDQTVIPATRTDRAGNPCTSPGRGWSDVPRRQSHPRASRHTLDMRGLAKEDRRLPWIRCP